MKFTELWGLLSQVSKITGKGRISLLWLSRKFIKPLITITKVLRDGSKTMLERIMSKKLVAAVMGIVGIVLVKFLGVDEATAQTLTDGIINLVGSLGSIIAIVIVVIKHITKQAELDKPEK